MKPDFFAETRRQDLIDETGTCQKIAELLSRVGDKWSVLIVSYLGTKSMRFNELRREIGNISQKMLTASLRNLERDGFVTRIVTPSRPPRVDYELTDLGHDLLNPVLGLVEWTRNNATRIESARRRYDRSGTV